MIPTFRKSNGWRVLKGQGAQLPTPYKAEEVLLAGLGGAMTIALIAGLSEQIDLLLVMGSFGASCVLVFGFPSAPFSQPRNVVIGHMLATLVGLVALWLWGPVWWSVAIAVGVAISLMMLTRSVHPPAGSNPVIIFLSQPGWDFLVTPTLVGALMVVFAGLAFNAGVRKLPYPAYW